MANNPKEEVICKFLYADQDVVIDTSSDKKYGCITAFDCPLYERRHTTAVARAQGQHIQYSDPVMKGVQWFTAGNILFEETSRHSGSTIVFTGSKRETDKESKWAIVGGTGDFTFGQGGVIDYRDGEEEGLIQLRIRVLCRPVEKSELRYGFLEFKPSEIDSAIKEGKVVGEGGYGRVYKANIRGTTVAVKILIEKDLKAYEELENEIALFKTIRHENLVTLMGACIEKDALIYEFCHKGTLQDRLFPRRGAMEALSWKERVEIARSICSGLKFLHDQHIAHRDLKPNNILFDAHGVCKICDFGLSRLLKFTSDTATPYCYTVPAGTRDYCDPDPKFYGDPKGKLTPKSDVYSLGIILLQLVTGRGPQDLKKWVERNGDAARDTKERCEKLVDRDIRDEVMLTTSKQEHAVNILRLGLYCSRHKGRDRPDMAEVCLEIESIAKDDSSGSDA